MRMMKAVEGGGPRGLYLAPDTFPRLGAERVSRKGNLVGRAWVRTAQPSGSL